MNSQTETLDVTVTRRFDAPIELVYRAWTDPEHVVHWMKCDVEARLEVERWVAEPGAELRTRMWQPGVFEAEYRGRFTEVAPPNLLEFVYDANPALGVPEMTVRVELEADGLATVVTLTQSGIPAEFAGLIDGGWNASMAQLETLVSSSAPSREASS